MRLCIGRTGNDLIQLLMPKYCYKRDPGVTEVMSSGFRVAGFKMCRLPDCDPVRIDEELGENLILEDGY